MPRFVAPLPTVKNGPASEQQQQAPVPPLTPPPLHPSLRRRVPPPPPIHGTGIFNRAVSSSMDPPLAVPSSATSMPGPESTSPNLVLPNSPGPLSSNSSLLSDSSPGTPVPVLPKIIVEEVHPLSPGSLGPLDSPMLTPSEMGDEENLSEQQLRVLYDEEEMERFLYMFSSYVNEVRMPGGSPQPHVAQGVPPYVTIDDFPESQEDEDWVPVNSPQDGEPPSLPRPSHYSSLSQRIAMQYIMPLLPPPPPSPSQSSLGRLKVAAERLYLSIEPAYLPFFLRMHRLATWEDLQVSRKWCIVFWILWSQNLLLPALIARILYSLLRSRLFPYPSLNELRARRADAERAARFSEHVHARLLLRPGSEIGVQDAWKAIKFMNRSGRNLLGKGKAKDDKKQESIDTQTAIADAVPEEASPKTNEDWLELEEDDLIEYGLVMLTGLADFHERVRNIFLWRQPRASKIYGTALGLLFLATLLIPAQYLAKGVYFSLGFLFWHVVPVVAALPSSARARLPPMFSEVPTDLDYAMQLMSERIARGLPVRPPRRRRKRDVAGKFGNSAVSLLSPNASSLSLNVTERDEMNDDDDDERTTKEGRDWVRDAVKAVDTGKSWIGDGMKLVKDIKGIPSGTYPSKQGLFTQPETDIDTHPFLAQHTKYGPGLLTLTSAALFFAPFVSRSTPSTPQPSSSEPNNATTSAKVSFAMSAIRGVKKTGAFSVRGIAVRWADEQGQEREERFLWVRGREEAFARLVGTERRWLRV